MSTISPTSPRNSYADPGQNRSEDSAAFDEMLTNGIPEAIKRGESSRRESNLRTESGEAPAPEKPVAQTEPLKQSESCCSPFCNIV